MPLVILDNARQAFTSFLPLFVQRRGDRMGEASPEIERQDRAEPKRGDRQGRGVKMTLLNLKSLTELLPLLDLS